jgi:hypothetical protein
MGNPSLLKPISTLNQNIPKKDDLAHENADFHRNEQPYQAVAVKDDLIAFVFQPRFLIVRPGLPFDQVCQKKLSYKTTQVSAKLNALQSVTWPDKCYRSTRGMLVGNSSIRSV